jgi:hypothetical protein
MAREFRLSRSSGLAYLWPSRQKWDRPTAVPLKVEQIQLVRVEACFHLDVRPFKHL